VRVGGALVALAVATAAPSAAGQTTNTFAVDRFFMAGAPNDGTGIWLPDLSDQTRFFGQLGLGLSVNPLRAANIADNYDVQRTLKNPLTEQFITYLNAGVEIRSWVSLQVAFPLVLYQAGNPTFSSAMTTPTPVTLQRTVAGDLRVEARGVVFRTAKRDFKLALNAAVYVPSGNNRSYGGDNGVGAAFGLAAEYDARAVAVAVNAAYRLRPTVILNELPVSNELAYGVGAYVPLRRGTIRLGLEVFGAVGVNPTRYAVFNSAPPGPASRSNVGKVNDAPLEWMLNGRLYFTHRREAYVGLGAGTRLTGGFAPDFRGVAVVGGAIGAGPDRPTRPVSDPARGE
jgi:hypothetical protein